MVWRTCSTETGVADQPVQGAGTSPLISLFHSNIGRERSDITVFLLTIFLSTINKRTNILQDLNLPSGETCAADQANLCFEWCTWIACGAFLRLTCLRAIQ